MGTKARLINEVKELMAIIDEKWFVIDLDRAEIESKPYYYSEMASSRYYWGNYHNNDCEFYCIFDIDQKGNWFAQILEVKTSEFHLTVRFYRDKGNELYPVESDESELPLMDVKRLQTIRDYLKKLAKKDTL